MEFKRSYLKNLVYPFGYMLPSSLTFLSSLWLSNHYTPSDFGNYSLFRSAIFTLWPFLGLSTPYYLQSHFYKDNRAAYSKRMASSLQINLYLFFIIELLVILFYPFLQKIFEFDLIWIQLIPFVALNLCIIRIALITTQLKKKPIFFLSISIIQFVFFLSVLSVTLLKEDLTNWRGQAISLLISNIVGALFGLTYLGKLGYLGNLNNTKYLKDSLIFGASAIMLDICIVSIAFTDKIFIKQFISIESLGLFALASQLAAIITVLDTAFMQSIYPKLYELYSKNSKKEVVKLILFYLVILIAFTIVYVYLSPKIYSRIIGKSFDSSLQYLFLISASLILLSFYKLLVSKLYYLKKMQLLIIPSIFITVINIILHQVLIPKFGINGAIFTNIVSFGLLSFIVLFLINYLNLKNE